MICGRVGRQKRRKEGKRKVEMRHLTFVMPVGFADYKVLPSSGVPGASGFPKDSLGSNFQIEL